MGIVPKRDSTRLQAPRRKKRGKGQNYGLVAYLYVRVMAQKVRLQVSARLQSQASS